MKKPTIKTLEKKLDGIFSEFIRLSHANDKGECICVSCGRMFHWKDIDAGHWYSRRHKTIRWDEMNVHPECKYCNRFNPDGHIGYTKFMIDRYGDDVLMELTARKNCEYHKDRFIIEDKIKHYTKRVAELKKEKGL